MATKTLYPLVSAPVTPNFWGNIQEGGTQPATTISIMKLKPGKDAAPSFLEWRIGNSGITAFQSTSIIDSRTGPLAGTSATAGGDAFVAGPYTGTFANTAWSITMSMRHNSQTATGRNRCRVWKSANANGSSATALTASTLVSNIVVLDLVGVNATMSWSPGSTTLSNEYLFFEFEWEVTTAGGSSFSEAEYNQGLSSIVTPDFSTGGGADADIVRRFAKVYLRR